MYKVGQRVRVINIDDNPWNRFTRMDKDILLNKIFKLGEYLGLSGDDQKGWILETPIGNRILSESQFRALKKKSEVVPAAKVSVINLKNEVIWLNKVKKNFENAGKVADFLDEINRPPRGLTWARDVLATPTRFRQEQQGVVIPRPVIGFDEMLEQDEAPQRQAQPRIDWTDEQLGDDINNDTDEQEGDGT